MYSKLFDQFHLMSYLVGYFFSLNLFLNICTLVLYGYLKSFKILVLLN